MKKYIIIDNPDYADYFVENLKGQYIPITIDMYLKSVLESRGVSAIGISEYLSAQEIKKIYCDSSVLVDDFITELDKKNRKLYGEIFGDREVRLFYATMKYSFKRFIVNCYEFLKGMELIIQRNNVIRLAYLHRGQLKYPGSNSQHNAFSFPDDMPWRILQYWDYANKSEMEFLKIPLKEFPERVDEISLLNKAKNSLRPIKKLIQEVTIGSSRYSPLKKNILFIEPFYDFWFILTSAEMRKRYNIIRWDVDTNMCPKFLNGRPVKQFLNSDLQEQVSGFNLQELLKQFNFDIGGMEKIVPVQGFRFLSFVTPLIRDFLEQKLPGIVQYWRCIENIHQSPGIDALFWANPPHRYPGGIAVEFCRINSIPVIGMQHGGRYGSNWAGKMHFDLDFEKCNSYFSYGFNNDDLKKIYPDENNFPEMFPVGSSLIYDFAQKHRLRYKKKIKVKVIYPLDFFSCFFWKFEGRSWSDLFSFQRQILNMLLSYTDKNRIILKFILGGYKKHPLSPCLEDLEPHNLEIIDNISFSEALERYEPDIILLDNCSTPLSQSLVTKSDIIVYNEKCTPLAKEAFNLLDKRAFVCNSPEEYLKQLEQWLNGKADKKDLENREFLEKYVLYKGNPQKNIINKIPYILKDI